jgi:hypothetical protein
VSMCEKCWSDAGRESFFRGTNKSDEYSRIMDEREKKPCTPEQQAGPDAQVCPECYRWTIHQHTGECMNLCGTAWSRCAAALGG